jgi:ribosomal protein S12 methylthiotransferase
MGEAERLAAAGVRELLVISQDTSAYGVDLKYRLDFWGGRPLRTRMRELCEALGSLGIWIRLHYVYPYPHVDEIIPLMAEGRILPYLDIPFQHGSPEVLRRMKRPAAAENTLERIRRWREVCPDLAIRSTFIVGFPGETDEQFDELLEFLEEAQLDRGGCFTYSPVVGARANELEGAVPDEVKEERWHRFMQTQARISAARLQARVGTLDEAGQLLRALVEFDIRFSRRTRERPMRSRFSSFTSLAISLISTRPSRSTASALSVSASRNDGRRWISGIPSRPLGGGSREV